MEHRAESLFTRATSPPMRRESVVGRGGRKTDPIGDLVAVYVDEVNRITALTEELFHEAEELEQLLRHLKEPHRSIMEMRYFDLLSWDQVSYKCGYAKSQMLKFHAEALEELTAQTQRATI
jgi:DNA-directed RNA polymerase specialized sigma subunit